MTGKLRLLLSSFSAALCLCVSHGVLAEEVFGQWCEPASEYNDNQNRSVEFVWTDDEQYLARFTTADGKVTSEVLTALPGNIYVQEGNVYGHRYRVHRTSAKLQLMDNTGVLMTSEIRTEGQPASSCF